MDAQTMTIEEGKPNMTDDEMAELLAGLSNAEAKEQNAEDARVETETKELLAQVEAGDIDLGDLNLSAPEAEPVDEAAEVSDEDEAAIDAAAGRAEVYAEQEASEIEGDVVASGDTSASPVVKGAKKARAAKAPAGPRPERDLNALPAETFRRFASDVDVEVAKADVIAARPTQVKIAEKFDQLWNSLHTGRAPSTYVTIALKALKAAPGGRMTSAEMVAAMRATGLGDGTARSQTGQIMVLFAVSGIATRAGQVLTLNAESTVAEKLSKILSI